MNTLFKSYIDRWHLVPDGAPIVTHSSHLLPVLYKDTPAILKIAIGEERQSARLMRWWNGEGAAVVFEHEGDALLMERATGKASLASMAQNGQDDEASRIICTVAARLHAPRNQPPAELLSLTRWFRELEPAAEKHGGILTQSLAAAKTLLNEPRDVVVLHGDIHHGNILDFSPRGWLAIDPKYITGERGFDFANIFCNPNREIALSPGRLTRQAHVVAQAAGLDRRRLLQWILAYAGLSAAWDIGENKKPMVALDIAEIAAAELEKES